MNIMKSNEKYVIYELKGDALYCDIGDAVIKVAPKTGTTEVCESVPLGARRVYRNYECNHFFVVCILSDLDDTFKSERMVEIIYNILKTNK